MYDYQVLIVIVLAIVGFGCVVLLGAFLPRQLDDEEDKKQNNSGRSQKP